MALAPFFERIYNAVGGHLSVSRDVLSHSLRSVTVGIECGTDLNLNDVWTAELSANLLSRLYPRLSISGPNRLCSSLKRLALKINPAIEFAHKAPGRTTICVGSSEANDALYPAASGWVARLLHSRNLERGPSNPYAAAAAAALACSELFRRLFSKSGPERDVFLSLLDYGGNTGANRELTSGNVGEVLFVGIGGVGNAAIWCLARHAGLQGKLLLAEPEDLTLPNAQRYLLGMFSDVNTAKVELARRELQDTRLTVEAYRMSLEQFADLRGGINIPTICISTDNKDSRRSAQALLPKLAVSGWTGDGSLGASWHVFSRNAACLACLYHPHGQGLSQTDQAALALGLTNARAAELWVTRQGLASEDLRAAAHALGIDESALAAWRGRPLADLYSDVFCGAVQLDIAGIRRVEAVPLAHQSALAGIFMASELLKRTSPELAKLSQIEPLVGWDDVLRPPPNSWRRPRPRESGCFCGDSDYQAFYLKTWGRSSEQIAIVA